MTSDQTTLVPSFIIHLNGRRLEMEEEFSVQSVTVTERLNDIATASVVFSDPELQLQKKEEVTIGSEITVTMGYKDDVKTLFKGDIVSENITLKRDRPPAYTIKGANKLHKIRKHISQAIFYEMTESQVIQKIMDNNGISVVTDDFGREHPIYASSCLSDYDLLKKITDFHGYDFYLRDSTLYLEKHSSRMGSDVILEWGKSLVDCAFKEEVTGQMNRSIVSSWDLYNAQDYASEVDNSTINAEGPEWAEEFGAAGINMVRENNLISTDETEKRAETILVQQARQFQKISGSCEGNTAIVAGSVVELKEIGNRISKEYLVNAVSHILEADKGYRTVFRLVSNVGAPDGKPVGMTKGTTAEETEKQNTSKSVSDQSETPVIVSSGSEEEPVESQENEKTPQITNPAWKNESGNQINTAHVGQNVLLTAQVQDIDDGESLSLKIIEKDSQGEDDHISTNTVKVSEGKAEYHWKVEYVNDDDDVSQESEEGYSLPEYVFICENSDGSCVSKESPLLEVKNWIYKKMVEGGTGKLLADKPYEILFKDGSSTVGRTDSQGIIDEKDMPYMDYSIILKEE